MIVFKKQKSHTWANLVGKPMAREKGHDTKSWGSGEGSGESLQVMVSRVCPIWPIGDGPWALALKPLTQNPALLAALHCQSPGHPQESFLQVPGALLAEDVNLLPCWDSHQHTSQKQMSRLS